MTGNATVSRSAAANPAGLLLENGALIDGNVEVERNAQFAEFGGSTVGRSVHCNRCQVADAHQSTVNGDLRLVGVSQGADTVNSIIGGKLQIQDGFDTTGFGFTFTGNSVGSSLKFVENTGPSTITGNTIANNLICAGNTPPPTGVGNTATLKSGQCSAL